MLAEHRELSVATSYRLAGLPERRPSRTRLHFPHVRNRRVRWEGGDQGQTRSFARREGRMRLERTNGCRRAGHCS